MTSNLIADVNPDLVNLYKTMVYHTDALLIELETLFSASSVSDEENWLFFLLRGYVILSTSPANLWFESVNAAARFFIEPSLLQWPVADTQSPWPVQCSVW